MPYCKREDFELYYETQGADSPLLLISGLGGGVWSWSGQIPFFRRHYKTIVFDNRGAGLSGKPQGPYDMRRMAEDVVYLLDCLEIESAYVLALSMGGMIALQLAVSAPQRIRALVLGCAHCGGAAAVRPSAKVLEILLNTEASNREEVIERNLPIFLGESCRRDAPQVVDAYRKMLLQAPIQPIEAFQAQMAAIASFDCSAQLEKIDLPTLIVTGTEDILVPPQNSEYLAGRIPNAELVKIRKAGHALHFECRDILNELAHGFFSRHPWSVDYY